MDGETNGSQQEAQSTQGQEGQQQETQGQQEVTGSSSGTDYEKQIAERDEKIASLEAQVAEAAKNAETAEQLRGEIAELKAQGESDRIDFKLQLAGGHRPALRPRQRRGQAQGGRALALRGDRQARQGRLCRLRHDRATQRGGSLRRGQDAQALA